MDLPVAVRRCPEVCVVANGPGRLLHIAYLTCGGQLGRHISRWAYQLGYGPDAAAKRIEEHFGHQDGRLSRLIDLNTCKISNELEKDCLQLMKYALP